MHGALAGRLPIIGVGGISDVDSALRKQELGASLVQVYTGFIYRGPVLVRDITKMCVPPSARPPASPHGEQAA